jgi:hypothetical protein
MTTDLYSRVYFNDGEGLDFNDLNNMQSFLRAKWGDQVLQYLMGAVATSGTKDPAFAGQNGANAPSRFAYCLHSGQAYLKEGGANNIILVAPGTLYQKVGNSDGSEATMLGFTFTGAEQFALTAGDATNPRVDLLQMKLEYITDTSTSRDFEDGTTHIVTSTTFNKKKRVQCTLSVKTGTPAATPQIPEPDAGYVVIGTVMVGHLYAIGGNALIFGIDATDSNNAVVHDQRMPLGRIREYRVEPNMFKLITGWTLAGDNTIVSVSNATNTLYVPYTGPSSGRIVGVGIYHTGTDGTMTLGNAPGIVTTVFRNRNTMNQLTSGGDDITLYYDIESHHNPSFGPTITQSATTKIGVPLWGNGQRCPREKMRIEAPGGVNADQLFLKIVNADNVLPCQLGAVVFYVAEGI